REVWDSLHDSTLARTYDESLAGTPLLDLDLKFVERHLTAPGSVIDLGCGTGRVAVPLARRGLRGTAVGPFEAMLPVAAGQAGPTLQVAGEKAAAAGVTVHRLKANIAALDGLRGQVFDAALCLFSTLGMVAGPEARRRVVAEAYRLLRPGGVFVLHVHNRWHHL